MVKVEAVVTRERVETVIDAVEHESGHVGVTVVEAIGHGRQRGITHEYRGRIFESRFLPKALQPVWWRELGLVLCGVFYLIMTGLAVTGQLLSNR